MTNTMNAAVFSNPMPKAIRFMGGRWRDGKRSFRMKWGELSFGNGGFALELCLWGDSPHFSLQLRAFWVQVFIRLPFLRRFAYDPQDMMDSWGVTYDPEMGLFLRWGAKCKILHMPWRNWMQVSHDVQRPDGSWTPFVGSWERDKKPDGRHTETQPYHYLLSSGEKQDRTATIYTERRIHRLKLLCWTRLFQRVSHSISVEFSDEVGEGTGSWKGGTIGCGYDLRSDESPRQCLSRMERERRFPR